MTDEIRQPRCNHPIAHSRGMPLTPDEYFDEQGQARCGRLISGWEQPTTLSHGSHFVSEVPAGPRVRIPCGHPIYSRDEEAEINRWMLATRSDQPR